LSLYKIERIIKKIPISQLCFLFIIYLSMQSLFSIYYNTGPRHGIHALFNILIVHFAMKFKFCLTCIFKVEMNTGSLSPFVC
jgi:hypothetical protein